MLRPIRNEKQYEKALARAYDLMQIKLKSGSQEADELEVLSLLIENYEEKHYAIAPPHPIEAIKFRLDQMGLKPSDLEPILGYRSRVSEILGGKRKLTIAMIRNLHNELHIPLESLFVKY
jgi:HTH-type transcriptional regulator/antitoxin HigA